MAARRVLVRGATADDREAVAALLAQLGYPAAADAVAPRLAALEAWPGAAAWVADLDGTVAGIVTVHVFPSVHASEPAALLTTLVVAESHRRRGVARALTERAESFARDQGARRISVSSGLQRVETHEVYERLGYARSGVRLTKSLAAAAPGG